MVAVHYLHHHHIHLCVHDVCRIYEDPVTGGACSYAGPYAIESPFESDAVKGTSQSSSRIPSDDWFIAWSPFGKTKRRAPTQQSEHNSVEPHP